MNKKHFQATGLFLALAVLVFKVTISCKTERRHLSSRRKRAKFWIARKVSVKRYFVEIHR